MIKNAEKRAVRFAIESAPDVETKALARGEAARRVVSRRSGTRSGPNWPGFAAAAGEVFEEDVRAEAATATREYIEWVLEARDKLAAWEASEPPRDNPPVSGSDETARQVEAVTAGADARVIQAVELEAPESLIAMASEAKLIRAILGTA